MSIDTRYWAPEFLCNRFVSRLTRGVRPRLYRWYVSGIWVIPGIVETRVVTRLVLQNERLILTFLVLLLATDAVLMVIAGRRHKRARMKLNFVASLSHELLTPVAAIYCTGQNARDGLLKSEEDLQQHRLTVTTEASRLTLLLKQVLLFASTENKSNYQLRPVSISDVVELAHKNLAVVVDGSGFEIEKQIPGDLPLVIGDLSGLSHCLQALLLNAVKYSRDNCRIEVSASFHPARHGAGEVRIGVADRGAGISSAELPHIFDPFYRSPQAVYTKVQGSGLGLAVAKQIADALGAKLSVKSEIGVGSLFTLHIPAVRPSDTRVRVPAATARGAR